MTLTPVRRLDADVAIVGSRLRRLAAARSSLRQRGRRVALIERGRHPRFAIGESTTPLTNLLLEELADRYDLPQIRPFSKWGTWQRAHPERRLRPEARLHVLPPPARRAHSRTTRTHARQLLVAASPHDDIADTHWYRPDFDRALVERSRAAGARPMWTTEPRRGP